MLNIYLASPRGYCAGVDRAINILNGALEKYKAPIFVNHEIIHNKIIINYFEKKGVIFEDNLDLIPSNSIMIFSAHGVSPGYVKKVKDKNLKYIDASCPLVLKVHFEAKRYLQNGYKIIYIGKKSHQEALGVLGESSKDIFIVENESDVDLLKDKLFGIKLALLTQTTLSVLEKQELENYILSSFENIEIPKASDICYATTNRQNAVINMIEQKNIDALIIVGSKNSSNSNKLRDIGDRYKIKSVLIDSFSDLDLEFLSGVKNLGISSGASVGEDLVQDLIEKLEKLGVNKVEEVVLLEEDMSFPYSLELK